ncbi:MAG: RNA methyltransferase, partial [Anaerolineaceae bacterium]|nr:RNA methyltransferase [Anaerolineaceae bacterium]
HRRKENAFVAEGVRLVEEGIHEHNPVRFILFSDGLSERGMSLIANLPQDIDAFQVEDRLFQDLSDTQTAQGILAVFEIKPKSLPDQPDFLLITDGLRDPGNLGTILRSAEAAGAQGVLLAPGTTDAYSPKVVRAGMGAHFRLPILSLAWPEISQTCGGLTVFSADMQGKHPYWQADFTTPAAILIGSEADGLSPEGLTLTQQSVHIPMPGKSESLNAGLAAVILIFEVVRQRSK